MNFVKDKKILIIGFGTSGIAAAKLCVEKGARVTITDYKKPQDLLTKFQELSNVNLSYYLGTTPEDIIKQQDIIVVSPGVTKDSPYLKEAIANNIPIWSEIELAYYFCPCPVIAITGTNGKSTTTLLLGEIFKTGGYNTYVLGNIGTAFSEAVLKLKKNDIVILEVSAGQLEACSRFKPTTSVITNINPEHINLYKSFEYYIQLKSKILKNQTEQELSVLNWDDELVREISNQTSVKKIYFSKERELPDGVFIEGSFIVAKFENTTQKIFSVDELYNKGSLPNILAAIAVSLKHGVHLKDIQKAIREFKGQKHAMEFVCTINDVDFINDSKATNPWSTIHAIDMLDKPIILITGGKDDKESEFSKLLEKVSIKVKQVVVIGETSMKIMEESKKIGFKKIIRKKNLQEAVETAFKYAESNEIVLFSPGANSKDMFLDHKNRGQVFKDIAANLKNLYELQSKF